MYRINIKNHGGTQYKTNAYTEGREIFIWREIFIRHRDEDNGCGYDAGWYACIRGIGPTGLYSETDNVGPFDDPQSAGMEAIDMLVIDHENELETAAERGEDTTELAAEQQALIEYVTAQVSLLGTMTTVATEPHTHDDAVPTGASVRPAGGKNWVTHYVVPKRQGNQTKEVPTTATGVFKPLEVEKFVAWANGAYTYVYDEPVPCRNLREALDLTGPNGDGYIHAKGGHIYFVAGRRDAHTWAPLYQYEYVGTVKNSAGHTRHVWQRADS